MAYMDKAVQIENNTDVRLADDKAAIQWLLHNVQGSPVILEAQIPGISLGQPLQRLHWPADRAGLELASTPAALNRAQHGNRAPASIMCRRSIETPDLLRAHSLIDLYGYRYIVVGGLRRAYYSPEGLAKFDAFVQQGLLKPVYRGRRRHDLRGRGGHDVVGHDATAQTSAPIVEPATGTPASSNRRWNEA